MKILFKEVRIRMRDGASIITKRVPSWEVPVLQAVWPETQELRDTVGERESVSVSGEFGRLMAVYGSESNEGGERGLPHVAAVYGQHGAGQAALRAAIQAAVLPENTPVTPRDTPPTINSDLYEAIKSDVALGLEEERVAANARVAAAAESLLGVTA